MFRWTSSPLTMWVGKGKFNVRERNQRKTKLFENRENGTEEKRKVVKSETNSTTANSVRRNTNPQRKIKNKFAKGEDGGSIRVGR